MKTKILLIFLLSCTSFSCEKKSEQVELLYDSSKHEGLTILDISPKNMETREIMDFLVDLNAKGYNAIRINQSGQICILEFNFIIAREKNAPPLIRGDDSERIQRFIDMGVELDIPAEALDTEQK